MPSAGLTFLPLLKTTGQLARTRLGAVALAAVVPFVASHVVVMTARQIGMPERLVLDLLHGFIVLSYLTAAVRIGQSRAQGRAARFGFALPRRIALPGFAALARMAGVVVLIGLPAALLLHPLVEAAEAWQAQAGLYLPVTMIPEFVMTTVVALVLAAGTGKVAS